MLVTKYLQQRNFTSYLLSYAILFDISLWKVLKVKEGKTRKLVTGKIYKNALQDFKKNRKQAYLPLADFTTRKFYYQVTFDVSSKMHFCLLKELHLLIWL